MSSAVAPAGAEGGGGLYRALLATKLWLALLSMFVWSFGERRASCPATGRRMAAARLLQQHVVCGSQCWLVWRMQRRGARPSNSATVDAAPALACSSPAHMHARSLTTTRPSVRRRLRHAVAGAAESADQLFRLAPRRPPRRLRGARARAAGGGGLPGRACRCGSVDQLDQPGARVGGVAVAASTHVCA